MSSSLGTSGKFGPSHKVWEDVSTSFTEFGALSSEKKQSGGFFSRLWKRNKGDDNASTSSNSASAAVSLPLDIDDGKDSSKSSTQRSSPSTSESTDPSPADQSNDASVEVTSEGNSAVPHRNLSNVLSRLSSILDQRSTTPQTYKDSDFKQYWMPDRSCRECYDCGDKFTTFRRRHHCRICGQIFCSKCCNQELPGKIIGYKGGIRVCTYCCRVVQRYAQQSSSTGDMRALEDLRAMSQQIYESDSFDYVSRSLSPRVTDDMSPQYRESLPELPNLTTPDHTMPFDLTPQTEFSTEESLLLESKLLIQDSVQLRTLWRQICDGEMGVETQTLRIRLRTHQNCIVGKELVDWLIKKDKAATRMQAVGMGQALLYAGYMECVGSQPPIFKDNFTLYRPGEMASAVDLQGESEPIPTITEEYEKNEPSWLKEIEKEDDSDEDDGSVHDEMSPETSEVDGIVSSTSQAEARRLYYLNDTSQSGSFSEMPKLTLMSRDLTEEPLPRQDSSVHGLGDDFLKGALFLGKAPMPSSDVVTCPHGWRVVEQLREENGEKLAYTRLKKAHSDHWQSLIRQMLSQNGLLLSWESVIASCITQVSHFVRPDVRLEGDDMDIRNYVHIKKVPGGSKNDTFLTHGVIFTKNIAHKKMKTRITNPLILLLRGTIEFQRVEQKFSSLEPQILQEKEFMRNCVMKMIAYRPNVIVVEKSVSRLAQDLLLQCGITLLYNVKLSVMERLARFTQADIVPSIDGLVSKPNMGFCHDFRCQTYTLPNKEIKTLAVFDGCATHLGCTIVLSGGSISELRRVKQILKFMIHTAYNSLLELCFCMDEFALPQPMGDELTQSLDSWKQNSPDLSMYSRSIGLDELSNLAPKTDDQEYTVRHSLQMALPLAAFSSSRVESSSSGWVENVKEQQPQTATDNRRGSVSEVNSHEDNTIGKKLASFENCVRTSLISDTVPEENHTLDSNSSSRSNVPVGKLRHSSGLSTSSVSKDDLSGRSSPETFTEPDMSWDGNAKVVGGILCIIQKTEPESTKLRHPSSISAASGSLKQEDMSVADISEFEDSADYVNSLDYTVIDKSEADDFDRTLNLKDAGKTPSTSSSKEQKGNVSQLTELTDFSDPLLGYQNTKDESIFHSEPQSALALKEIKQSHYKRFRKALDGVHLSISPYHKYCVPFIETNKGLQCNSRKYLPEEIFWSRLFDGESDQKMYKTKTNESDTAGKSENIEILTSHPFLTCDLTQPIWDYDMQTILADFRARGGRIRVVKDHNGNQQAITHNDTQSSIKKEKDKEKEGDILEGGTSNNNTVWERKACSVDCLDPMNHQRLLVLFSSFSFKSTNHPHPCVYPWVVTMDFYGRNDITLGGFLERFCFRKQYLCPSPSCDIPMTEHIRRFVHGNACINVLLKKLDNEVPGGKENILMWSWCRKCKQVTPVVPISADTWSLSFAKYLDLRFHSSTFLRRASAEPCPHSLHHEHFQYFGHRDIVASFKYSTISLRELALPNPTLKIKPYVFDSPALAYKVRQITNRGIERYSQIWENTMKLKHEMTLESQSRIISDFLQEQQHDKTKFRDSATNVQMKIQELIANVCNNQASSPGEVDFSFQLFSIFDNTILLKRYISEDVMKWNARLQEFVHHQQKKSRSQLRKEKDLGSLDETGLEKSSKSTIAKMMPQPSITAFIPSVSPAPSSPVSIVPPPPPSCTDATTVTVTAVIEHPVTALTFPSETNLEHSTDVSQADENTASTTTIATTAANTATTTAAATIEGVTNSSIETMTTTVTTTAVTMTSTITDAVAAAAGPKPLLQHQLSAPLISTTPASQQPPPLSSLPQSSSLSLSTTPAASSAQSTSAPYNGAVTPPIVIQSQPPQLPLIGPSFAPLTNEVEDSTEGWLQDLKGVTRRWLSNSSFTPLPLPFDLNEHHALPICERVPIAVYDNEPSSIIAYALSSSDYLYRLREVQSTRSSTGDGSNQGQGGKQTSKQDSSKSSSSNNEGQQEPGRKTKVLSFLRGATSSKDVSSQSSSSSNSGQSSAGPSVDSVRYIPTPDRESGTLQDELSNSASFPADETPSPDEKSKVNGNNATSPHIELQFSDSSARFYCRIYYADQFRKLRKLILPGNDNTFIRSLSRCKPWEAKGGKSGSAFSKTDDDRFILKQMSTMELDSFEKFGPQYFTYIKNCLSEEQPTALAKILGVFRIGFRNSQTTNALRQDLLVMENLFYERKIVQKFDLKGSIRNRMVTTSGRHAEEELVLLDENLLKSSVESPLYLRPHNKHVLKSAITSDTVFLSSNLVMDYSLLVGIVEDTDEMLVGIIDYIRTFTWDKKLEMVFKSSGILGGQGKMPTVVSPQLYRGRFLEAMDRYFLHVPDRWTGLGMDCPMKQTKTECSDQVIH